METIQRLMNNLLKVKSLKLKFVLSIFIILLILSTGGYFGYKSYIKYYNENYYKDPKINKVSEEQIKKMQERKQELITTLKDFPDYFEVYLELGQIARNLGEYKEAFDYNQQASKILPSSSAPYMNMGIYSVELSHYDAAEKYFTKAIEVTPDYYLAYQKLGDLYSNYYTSKKGEADAVYRKGIEATNNEELVRDYADYLNKSGEKAEALKYYKQLQQASPEDEAIKKMNEEVEKSLKENPPE